MIGELSCNQNMIIINYRALIMIIKIPYIL
jgi:hypothetical protein